LARAKKENKPLLIDFYGIWCPPCNELEENVFSSPRFTSETNEWIKLRLDADTETSWPLKSRYRVGGYPTIILANSNGDEIQRIVGFMPLPELLTTIKSAWNQRLAILEKPLKEVQSPDTPFDLMTNSADALEKAGNMEKAKATWAEAAALLRAELHPDARGGHLDLAYALWKSGDIIAAERIYERFEKRYPSEFTFFYGHANMLLTLGRAAEALTKASKAFEYSYGDNRLRTAHLLARAHTANGHKSKALTVVKSAIADAHIPSDANIRTHRYLKALKELETELSRVKE
jgi:tetratricopeptide (TPR) repeat protein